MDVIDLQLQSKFIDKCHNVAHIDAFKTKLYPTLKMIIPHKMFAFVEVRLSDLNVKRITNLSFSSEYLEKTKAMTCPAIYRWAEIRKPSYICSDSILPSITDVKWLRYFKKFKVNNLSAYGSVDYSRKYANVFVFGGLESWDKNIEYKIKFLVPQLHYAFSGIELLGMGQKDVLTRRESEVLTWISKGKSNAEVASQLSISPWTVKIHVSNLMSKLDASNRGHAIARALEMNLLEA